MTEFSEQIWDMKYRYKDKDGNPIDITVEDTWRRVAKGIAVNETDKQYWENEFYEILKDYKFLPGGRILSNAGTSRKKTTFFNCYVSGKIEDSIESIIDNVKTSALTQRGGGGIGFDFSSLRPKGAYVKGVEAQSSGPVSFMEIFNATCKTISSAGQRRGAMLAALRCDHPDIELFIDAKRDNVSLANFNLSVAITTTFIEAVKEDADWELSFEGKVYKTVKAKYLWDKIIKSTYDYAEPGILMVDTINEMNNLHYCEDIRTTNPCLTGDSMVAVADGRGSVSIKQLAEEEVDVPVYCIDNNKKTVVKTMRHPRITGYDKPVYKITFNDGNSVKCTDNHKWLLSNFEYKETKDLKAGDSFHLVSKFQETFGNIVKSKSGQKKYWWLQNKQTNKLHQEHREIYAFNNEGIEKGFVIHHKDGNGLNNNIQNLEKMLREDHYKHHGKEMEGENNPMVRGQKEWSKEKWQQYHDNMSASVKDEKNGRYLGGTLEEKKKLILEYCKEKSHNCSEKEFIKYCKSQKINPFSGIFKSSKYHNNLTMLIKAVCEENDIPIVNLQSQTPKEKALKVLQNSNYKYRFNEELNNYYVEKTCEVCGKVFEVVCFQRERAFCSKTCGSKNAWSKGCFDVCKEKLKEKQEEKLRTQALFYSKLKKVYNRDLILSEWQAECKKEKIPHQHRYQLVGYTWGKFINAVNNFNHTIVSVERVANEDVYNGTVDDYHNFYCTLPDKNSNLFLINNLQCGEQVLPFYGNCLLGSINLTRFVKNVFTNKAKVDYEAIGKTIAIATRLLDNVIDISNFPMKDYEEAAKDKRRMGIGITGLADMFTFLGIKYGSKESSEVAEKVMKTITEAAYKSSIELAKEKGQFSALDKKAYLESNFIKQLSKEIQEGIKEHGIRNSHLTSIAPTGTISLYAGNVSSGLEPIFATSYNRKIRIENDEEQTQEVVDYAVQKYRDEKQTIELPEYFITTNDVLPEQHLEVQSVLQKWVDSSISKTINVPENYPFEDFKSIYMDAYEKGLKGCTTFRPNPKRQGILSVTKDDGFPNYTKIKRPEKLKCDIHKFRAGGEDWVAFVSLMNGRPFELFAGHHSEEYVKLPNKFENASMIKKKFTHKSRYTLELNNGDITVNDVLKYFPYDESFGALTRFISMNLQAGVLVKFIVEQLHKINYTEFHHFNLGLARILKKYINDGEGGGKCEKCSGKLIYQSGCPTCSQCGFSKCG